MPLQSSWEFYQDGQEVKPFMRELLESVEFKGRIEVMPRIIDEGFSDVILPGGTIVKSSLQCFKEYCERKGYEYLYNYEKEVYVVIKYSTHDKAIITIGI